MLAVHLERSDLGSRVLLDHAPISARYLQGTDGRDIDLGSHGGLSLEGNPGALVRALPDETRGNDIAVDITGAVKLWCETRLAIYKQPQEIGIRSD